MKAILFEKYGSPDVLVIKEVAKPTPNDDQVLIKVKATAVNPLDWHRLRADPFIVRFSDGLRKPKNPYIGADIAGEVEAVGKNVTQFQPGDAVYGEIGSGGLAEYVCAAEKAIVAKPANLSFVEAAAVPVAALTALQSLRDHGQLQAGQSVLINGASGGVGTYAVQIAKAFGAVVTAVCSTGNMEMVRSIGADHVIDYTKEDFTQNGQQYDLIIAANGYHPISDYKRALSPTGIYVMTGGSTTQMFQAMTIGPLISMTSSKTMSNMMAKPNQKDLIFMQELLETGKVAPVIDRRYPLSEVPDAIRYLEEGHAKGKVVITIEQNSD